MSAIWSWLVENIMSLPATARPACRGGAGCPGADGRRRRSRGRRVHAIRRWSASDGSGAQSLRPARSDGIAARSCVRRARLSGGDAELPGNLRIGRRVRTEFPRTGRRAGDDPLDPAPIVVRRAPGNERSQLSGRRAMGGGRRGRAGPSSIVHARHLFEPRVALVSRRFVLARRRHRLVDDGQRAGDRPLPRSESVGGDQAAAHRSRHQPASDRRARRTSDWAGGWSSGTSSSTTRRATTRSGLRSTTRVDWRRSPRRCCRSVVGTTSSCPPSSPTTPRLPRPATSRGW